MSATLTLAAASALLLAAGALSARAGVEPLAYCYAAVGALLALHVFIGQVRR